MNKQKGISQIVVMVIMLVLAIALPITTNLVKQSQENRSKATSLYDMWYKNQDKMCAKTSSQYSSISECTGILIACQNDSTKSTWDCYHNQGQCYTDSSCSSTASTSSTGCRVGNNMIGLGKYQCTWFETNNIWSSLYCSPKGLIEGVSVKCKIGESCNENTGCVASGTSGGTAIQSCTQAGGTACTNAQNCALSGGTAISGTSCSGSTPVCCKAAGTSAGITQDTQCKNAGGTCQKTTASCSGSYQDNFCPSSDSSIKCCVPGTTVGNCGTGTNEVAGYGVGKVGCYGLTGTQTKCEDISNSTYTYTTVTGRCDNGKCCAVTKPTATTTYQKPNLTGVTLNASGLTVTVTAIGTGIHHIGVFESSTYKGGTTSGLIATFSETTDGQHTYTVKACNIDTNNTTYNNTCPDGALSNSINTMITLTKPATGQKYWYYKIGTGCVETSNTYSDSAACQSNLADLINKPTKVAGQYCYESVNACTSSYDEDPSIQTEIAGTCGYANGREYSTPPQAPYLCQTGGTNGPVTGTDTTYVWNCYYPGDKNIACSAKKPSSTTANVCGGQSAGWGIGKTGCYQLTASQTKCEDITSTSGKFNSVSGDCQAGFTCCSVTALTTTCARCTTSLASSGDANCDGKINELDFAVWLSEYKGTKSKADFNCSDTVDIADFSIWNTNFNK